MPDVHPHAERLELDNGALARAVEQVPAGEVPRQTLAWLDKRRVCIELVAPRAPRSEWLWYSAAAARRAGLRTERLAPLVRSGQLGECFYVAYDVGDALPLADYRQHPGFSLSHAFDLLTGIARALDGVVRDGLYPTEVGPGSVFVDPQGRPLLTDLGVAREGLGNPPAEVDANAAWVAPEVLSSGLPSQRSAVYSFGALAYTLLTGAPPHQGTADEIASADPPSAHAVRPDLPESLDRVIATAMARDPGRRYRSATEALDMVEIVLHDALSAPAREPRRRFARPPRPARPNGRPAAPAPPEPRAVERPKRRRPVLAGVLVLAAAAAGAVGGVLLGGEEEPAPVKPGRIVSGDVAMRVPVGWRGSSTAVGALEAHPEGDGRSGLTLEPVDEPVAPDEQAGPVRLGSIEAWRDEGVQVQGARSAVRYVIPTSDGKLVATCRASSRAEPGTLALCERTLSTLRLPAASNLPLADVVAQQEAWQAATNRLNERRAQARRSLAAADRPFGQGLAAEALQRVHERAATRFAGLPGGADVAAAARRTAAAYGALARAAGADSRSRWRAAVERVRRSEAALRRALDAA
jgi:Protein kinase domain